MRLLLPTQDIFQYGAFMCLVSRLIRCIFPEKMAPEINLSLDTVISSLLIWQKYLAYFRTCLVYCCCFTLDAGLLAISQYSEGPATGHLDTGFPSILCVYKQILGWFPTYQVATTCFPCSRPDLYLLVTDFVLCIHVK